MSDKTTANERLRQLLDDRGVEWTANDGEHVKETCWPYMCELMAAFAEYDNGTTRFACDTWCFTPEQAVEATLGAVHRKTHTTEYCDRCGGAVLPKWKKCPWCGAPLEEVES